MPQNVNRQNHEQEDNCDGEELETFPKQIDGHNRIGPHRNHKGNNQIAYMKGNHTFLLAKHLLQLIFEEKGHENRNHNNEKRNKISKPTMHLFRPHS